MIKRVKSADATNTLRTLEAVLAKLESARVQLSTPTADFNPDNPQVAGQRHRLMGQIYAVEVTIRALKGNSFDLDQWAASYN